LHKYYPKLTDILGGFCAKTTKLHKIPHYCFNLGKILGIITTIASYRLYKGHYMKRALFLVGLVVILSFHTSGAIASDLYGDFTNDRIVDMNDLREFCTFWLIEDCNLLTAGIDLDSDCRVNFYEFSQFADNWLLDVPAAPTGLLATAGDAKVLLDWNNNTEDNLTGYNVYRSITSGSNYIRINISLLGNSDYNDTNAVNETTYYYVVTAANTFLNESDDSNEVSATPHDATPPTPNPMTWATTPHSAGFTAIAMRATAAIDNLGSQVEYYFECVSGGGHSRTWSTDPNYTDNGLTIGLSYGYRVKARDAQLNETGWSIIGYALPGEDTTPPVPSPMIWATAPYAASSTSITMVAITAIDDNYGVEYYFTCTAGGGHSSNWQSGTTYTDTNLTPSTLYTYTVKARDMSPAQNETAVSSPASATTDADTTPPAAPTGLSATPSDAKVLLDWNDNSESDLQGYNVYRSTTSGSGYAKINTSLRTISDYNDTGVTNGTTYYYVVTAVDTATNESDYSSQASATPSGAPSPASPQNLMVPPMGWDDTQIILIWSKPVDYSLVTDYRVYKDGVALGLSGRFDTTRAKLYYIVTGLTANTTYNFTVKSLNSSGTELAASNVCTKATTPTPTILNISSSPYNASNNGTTKNTAAIQQAINDCPPGGVVLVPAGGTGYLTGGIYLKSNMTLKVDGTLIGDCGHEATDYLQTSLRVPYYNGGNNFMGLVNAYNNYTDPASAGKPYILQNIRICGSGTISGDIHAPASGTHTHTDVGNNENTIIGDDTRLGDMITIKGVTNFYLGGWGTGTLTLIRPPEHTMFISYCNGVTVNALNVSTYDLHNGDGLNLATTDTAYIFNSTFDAGDDCINMNAGQGQEGVDENVPVQNVRCFDCTALRGHGGWVIGSFTAAWVQDCVVEDLLISGTEIGIRQKTSQGSGGGGRRNLYRDIRIINITKPGGIFLDSNYTLGAGYTPAGPGQFSNNTYKNITVNSTQPTIVVNAPNAPAHTNNTFYNITGNKAATLKYCTNSTFNYCTVASWSFTSGTCSGLSGTNNTPQPTWP
jgi:exo-poly-alpha-galacturonosidase